MNYPTGFGNVKNRCNFLLTHPVSKDKIECIKVGPTRAIFLHENRTVARTVRITTMVLTDREFCNN